MDIIDTHLHLWDVTRHSYSWCAGIPVLNKSFHYRDYLQALGDLPRTARLVKSIVVEAAPDTEDIANETDWLLALVRSSDSLIGGIIAGCRPEQSEFPVQIDRLASIPEVKGVRRVLEGENGDLLVNREFQQSLSLVGNTRMVFELCVNSCHLPAAVECMRACPTVRFVLNHCGGPDIRSGDFHRWRQDLLAVSKLDNLVACKLSGLVTSADPQGELTDQLRPYVCHTLECFGIERAMFGSDWPVCLLACSLANWFSVLRELTCSLSIAERERLFCGNARSVYGIADN